MQLLQEQLMNIGQKFILFLDWLILVSWQQSTSMLHLLPLHILLMQMVESKLMYSIRQLLIQA